MSALAARRIRSVGRRVCQFASLPVCSFFLTGCLERTVTITSTPPDAIVWLNDTEVGRTPVTTAFTYYGDYAVRLRRDGYEAIDSHKNARAPIYEQAPLDLAATALPFRIKTRLNWHFDLKALPESGGGLDDALLSRARDLGARVAPPSP